MLLPVLALSLALGAKDPAVDRTEKFIAKLVEVKPDDGKLTAKDKEANQKIFSELDGYFDFLSGFITLDARVSTAKTQALLGWKPVGPSLIDDLKQGHYFTN